MAKEQNNPTGDTLIRNARKDTSTARRMEVEGARPKGRFESQNPEPATTQQPDRVRKINPRSKVRLSIKEGAGLIKKVSKLRMIIWLLSFTIIPYGLQIAFGVLTIAGYGSALAIDQSWIGFIIDALSFGFASDGTEALAAIGTVGALLCGLATFVWATAVFYFEKFDPMPGLSLLTLVICLVLLLVPTLSLFPVMWIWCAHVVISNLSKKST